MTDSTSRSIDTLQIQRETRIDAPIDIVFETLFEAADPKMAEMKLKIERWPGGRWYRDLGEGAGHLWGHVQVIKPPTLLELCGPMFMSYPVASHVQYRLSEEPKGVTRLVLTHQAMGLIMPEHKEGVNKGWEQILANIREAAQKKARR